MQISDFKVEEKVIFVDESFDVLPSQKFRSGRVKEVKNDAVVVEIDNVNYYFEEDTIDLLRKL